LLAIRDGRCIAGARISDRVSGQSEIRKLGPGLRHCCVWERFVFDPEARSQQLKGEFCRQLIEASRQLGFHHAMVLSSLRNARFYRRCHSALGVPFHIEGQVPYCAGTSFAGLEHVLSVAQLHSPLEEKLAA